VFYEQKDVSLYEKWEQSSPGKSLRKLSWTSVLAHIARIFLFRHRTRKVLNWPRKTKCKIWIKLGASGSHL
jgi:hypothetical protein